MQTRRQPGGGLPIFVFTLAVIACGGPALAANLVSNQALGLRVAAGFRVSLFADSDLANDIYAMTLDGEGNPVVTSQGYIRRLLDRNRNGVADGYEDIATTRTGGMGLLFEGNNFYFAGDNELSFVENTDGAGRRFAKPAALLPVNHGEHGGHAMRKGPDGWLYFIGGNDAGLARLPLSGSSSPIQQVEAGALLRLSPNGREVQVVAHGFRNPYDFDFNWLGDAFTYDSDVESDFLLPWYVPTRVYHVGFAQHHGWRLEGWRRSWPRPNYCADTVEMLAPMGRGSPTGVAIYRHFQFPGYYRNGLFALDWTFGKVYFLPVDPDGASYTAEPEVFLEPIGTQGFAPTDVVVTPEGSLLVSIGGRKTRGAIYRIDYPAGANATASSQEALVLNTLSEAHAVLDAPQPLEAWSRARWEPIARRLGAAEFEKALMEASYSPAVRVRAVEVLTELFGGLDIATAQAAARVNDSFVRSRVAWSLGRAPHEGFVPVLLALVRDADPMVRRCALEAAIEQAGNLNNIALQQAIGANLGHGDKRVHMAAARLATFLPDAAWNALWAQSARTSDLQTRLSLALAALWRSELKALHVPAIEAALDIIPRTTSPGLRLQAIRIIEMGLGDYNLHNPSVEVYTAYEPAFSVEGQSNLVRRVRTAVSTMFPSGNSLLDAECGRVLAMVGDNNPQSTGKALAMMSRSSRATDDFHWLTVLSRLQGPVPTNHAARVADVILSLERKLGGIEQRTKQNWSIRLGEVVRALLERDPKIADAMLRHPNFVAPAHLAFVPSFGTEQYQLAAKRFAAEVQRKPQFAWTGALIDLLDSLPAETVRPMFRQQWSNLALRDELLLKLVKKPEVVDREKFVQGLASTRPEVVRASVSALQQLPKDKPETLLGPGLTALRRFMNEPKESKTRADLVGLMKFATGQNWSIHETTSTSPEALQKAYQPLFGWFAQRYPALMKQVNPAPEADAARWAFLLKSVPWARGDVQRGGQVFQERGCQTCHATASALGPDLGGVAERLSPTGLFENIIYPNREVAGPYRVEVFRTHDGSVYNGIVAFESADGVILRTSATATIRLGDAEIVSRQPSNLSLMPPGLLEGLSAQGMADLYAYLKALGK